MALPEKWTATQRSDGIYVPDPASGVPRSLSFAGWDVNIGARSLERNGRSLRLSPRAISLLECLAETPRDVVRRDDLMDAIWPDVIVSDESLTQAVTELRRALGSEGRALVETVPRAGYRLNADVCRAAAKTLPGEHAFDLYAYQLCLDARSALTRGGRDVIPHCEALTREAAETAPDYAFARAEHAIALCYRWLYQRHGRDAATEALAEAEVATRLRPDLALGFAAKALSLGALGRSAEAVDALGAALQRDLKDGDAHFIGARIMFVLKQYRAAAALAERAAQVRPYDSWSLYFGSRAAAAFDENRSRSNAAACLRRVEAELAVDPNHPRARNLLGPLLATLGRTEEARGAIQDQADTETTLQVYDAIACATIGETDRALSCLDALAERGWMHGAWLAADPAFRSLAGNTRFQRIVDRIHRR
ncbi:MAG: transcriptional regulator [Pseudomonadota bacterium]